MIKIVKTNYFNNKNDPNAGHNMVRCIVDMDMADQDNFQKTIKELNSKSDYAIGGANVV